MIKSLSRFQNNILKYILLSVYLFFLFNLTGWINLNKEIPLDLDELAWVHDSQVFEWRSNQDWSAFSWSVDENYGWISQDFRLFDQPHFVKYIYGYMLTKNDVKPWSDKKQQEKNYLQFVQQSFSGKYVVYEKSSSDIFGNTTVESIVIARKISSFFGILFILLVATFFAKEFSIYQSAMISFLIVTNPVFQYNLNIATADSITMFFISITCILFYSIYKKNKHENTFLLLSSITAAIAASSKINGWILPILFVLIVMTQENKDVKKVITKIFSWFAVFIGFYIYLQPELWQYPLLGLIRYTSQRVTQQINFELNSQSLNIVSYHYWLLELYLNSKNELFGLIKSVLLFVVSLFLVKKTLTFFILPSRIVKLELSNFLKTNYLLILTLLLIWITIFLYAKIGFERYAMWPLLITFIITSRFIEKAFYRFLEKLLY